MKKSKGIQIISEFSETKKSLGNHTETPKPNEK